MSKERYGWSRRHALPSPREPLVTLGQEVAVRLKDRAARDADVRAVEALEAMAEHGPIGLAKNGGLHLDLKVGANAEQVAVERRVVQRAEGQAVRHHGLAARVAIGQDVGGLEQLLVAQAADGATLLVGREHALAEALLMEPLTGRAGDVH